VARPPTRRHHYSLSPAPLVAPPTLEHSLLGDPTSPLLRTLLTFIARQHTYPPSYVGMADPKPCLTAPAPLILTSGGKSLGPLHVYLALHISTGFSPLDGAVNYGTFRISLCLLYTHDHLSWTAEVFHEAVEKSLPRPSNQAVLLTGILRALWDHDASDHQSSRCNPPRPDVNPVTQVSSDNMLQ